MTINALVWMTQQLVKVTNVVGIQILNEPQNEDNLPDFYNSAIEAMRKVDGAEKFPLYLHDGFNIDQYSKWVGDRDDFSVVDHHSCKAFHFSSESASDARNLQTLSTRTATPPNLSPLSPQ